MCIGRCQRHSQPSNDPDVGLRRRDLRPDRQRGSARCQMEKISAGKFHHLHDPSARAAREFAVVIDEAACPPTA